MGRLPIVSAIAALAALTSLGGGICASQTLAATTASSKAQAVGYADAGSTTTTQVAASRGVLTTVTVDGVNLTSNGGGLTAVSAESLALLKAAHAQKKKAELLVGNFDGSIGDFSPAIGDRLLGSAAHNHRGCRQIDRGSHDPPLGWHHGGPREPDRQASCSSHVPRLDAQCQTRFG